MLHLGGGLGSLCLADLPRGRRLDELRFDLPIAGGDRHRRGDHPDHCTPRLDGRALAQALDCEVVEWEAIPEVGYDVLVNTTPVGSDVQGEPEEVVPEEWIRPGTLVFDAVYRPIRTPLLARAHAAGCTPVPGGEWFCRQAAAQFRLFTKAEPDEELMRSAFEHAHESSRS